MEPDREEIEATVVARFEELARNPAGEQRFPVGLQSALALGYPAEELAALPAEATESFAGVGSPFSLGQPEHGQTVVDIGCGSGTDVLVAARRVGPTGRAVGFDMTREMVARAEQAADSVGIRNVEFYEARADCLPYPDSAADLVISNGVFNLCVDKPRVASEIYRILWPGGRLQMADILLEPHVTTEEVARKGAWSD